MFCPKCGKQLRDGSRFCPGCGAQITVREKKTSDAEPKEKVPETAVLQEKPSEPVKAENAHAGADAHAVKKEPVKQKNRDKKHSKNGNGKKGSRKKRVLLIVPLLCALALCVFGVSKLVTKDGKKGSGIVKTITDRKSQKYLGTWDSINDNKQLIFFSNGSCVYGSSDVASWKVENGSLVITGGNSDFGRTELKDDLLSVLENGSVSSYRKSYPVGKEKYSDEGNLLYGFDLLRFVAGDEDRPDLAEYDPDGSFWVSALLKNGKGHSMSSTGDVLFLMDQNGTIYNVVKYDGEFMFFDRWLSEYRNVDYYTDFNGDNLSERICGPHETLLGVFEDGGEVYYWIELDEDSYDSHVSTLKVVNESTGEVKAQWTDNDLNRKYNISLNGLSYFKNEIKKIGQGIYWAKVSGEYYLFNTENNKDYYESRITGTVKIDDNYIYLERSGSFAVLDRNFNVVTDHARFRDMIDISINECSILKNGLIKIDDRDVSYVYDLSGKKQFDASRFDQILDYDQGNAFATMTNSAKKQFFSMIDTSGNTLFEPVELTFYHYEQFRKRFKYRIGLSDSRIVYADSKGNYIEEDTDVQGLILDGEDVYSLKITDGKLVKQQVAVYKF